MEGNFQPDLVVFYGGVNDTFDKRAAKSSSAEEALQMSRSMGLLPIGESKIDTIQN